MARDSEKRKRLKKQQKARTIQNKEKRAKQEEKERIEALEQYENKEQAKRELQEISLLSGAWMADEGICQKISIILNQRDPGDTLFMEYMLTEAMNGLILRCEQLYSGQLMRAAKWKKEAIRIVVRRCGKDPRKILEIASYDIQTERKLFLYVECLKREMQKGIVVKLLEYISKSLKAMQKRELWKSSIFILSWAELMFFSTVAHPQKYSSKVSEFQMMKDASKNKPFTDWNRYNRDIWAFDGELPEEKYCTLEYPAGRLGTRDGLCDTEKEDDLYWRESRSGKKPYLYQVDEIPGEISQKEYDQCMGVFLQGFSMNDILYCPNAEEYLVRLTTAMLSSQEWDSTMKVILLHNIRVLLQHLWREKNFIEIRSYINYFSRALMISEHKNLHVAGSGNLMRVIYAKDGVVILRSEKLKQPYIGCVHIFRGMTMQEVIDEYGTDENREILTNWDYYPEPGFPDNDYFPGWSLWELTLDARERKKRSKGWKKLGIGTSSDEKNQKLPIRDWRIEEDILSMNAECDEAELMHIEGNVVPENQFERDMQKGVEAYRNRRYAAAAKEFLNLLDEYPEEGMLYYYLANTFSYMTDGTLNNSCRQYALRFYAKALEYVDYVEVWTDYGNLLMRMGRTEEAITVLEKARERFPEEGIPLLILQNAYRNETQKEAAKAEALRKKKIPYNVLIREWESEHQILKPHEEEFV